jgi:dTDP-4-dehydrorhamnose reductase
MKVLVLGKSGMLGSMVYSYLKFRGVDIVGTQRQDENDEYYFSVQPNYNQRTLNELLSVGKFDYVVNCIGCTRFDRGNVLNFKTNFFINGIFPQILQEVCLIHSVRVIHISTDAVFLGTKEGAYFEDECMNGEGDYATSKIIGESYYKNILNIRCSIIGKELHTNNSLLDWFISLPQNSAIDGYTNYLWNGVTTYQFSEFCYELIVRGLFENITRSTSVVHLSLNNPTSKFALLTELNCIYKKEIKILPVQMKNSISRILQSRYLEFKVKNKVGLNEEILKMKAFFETNIDNKGKSK